MSNVTGSITLTPSSATAGQRFTVSLSLTNNAGTSIVINSIIPRIYNSTNVLIASYSGTPFVLNGSNTTISASATNTYAWTDVVYEPQLSNGFANDLSPESLSVDCIVYYNDGTNQTVSAATLTSSAPTR